MDRLSRIEGRLNDFLVVGRPVFQLFNHGIGSLRSQTASDVERALARARHDPDLRFPHRKIIEFLGGLYDIQRARFNEAHFSLVVRHARIGKSRARKYLALLEQKGHVQSREDGYRVFFRLRMG